MVQSTHKVICYGTFNFLYTGLLSFLALSLMFTLDALIKPDASNLIRYGVNPFVVFFAGVGLNFILFKFFEVIGLYNRDKPIGFTQQQCLVLIMGYILGIGLGCYLAYDQSFIFKAFLTTT